MDISIVVPLYRGSKYIDNIIKMIDRNVNELLKQYDVLTELVFINDYPAEKINLNINQDKYKFNISIVDTSVNRGIHGARVESLKYVSGKFLLFLDQDDTLADKYLLGQWEKLNDTEYDGIVCNVTTNLYDKFYQTTEIHRLVNDVEAYFATGNKIISPGSVLLKKSSIPKEWEENIQKINGADDFLLWCMMLFQNKKFLINEEVLFYHYPMRNSDSVGLRTINESLKESIDILYSCSMISEEKKNELEKGLIQEHIVSDEKIIERSYLTNIKKNLNTREERLDFLYETAAKWLLLKEENTSIVEYFKHYKINRIAIYGMSYLGDCLFKELDKAEIEVKYFVDKNVKFYWSHQQIPCVSPDEVLQGIDALIVTAVGHVESIRDHYKGVLSIPIISMAEIIEWFMIR